MKIQAVRIGAQRYTVTMQPDQVLDGVYGRITRKRCLIEVNKDTDKRQQADTLVHEVMHAMFFDAGLQDGDEFEERVVSALAPRLTAFLADNKDVVRQIMRVL